VIDPPPEPGRLVPADPRGPRTGVVVALLVAVFVGVALAKPWGTQVLAPAPSAQPSGGIRATQLPTVTAPSAAPNGPVADAFTIVAPPAASAVWSGMRWRRLEPRDPLNLVTSALRWRRGFIAVGWDPNETEPPTPVWTSQDGSHWEPLTSNASNTFWPGVAVVGLAEVPSGLVALTERPRTDCASISCVSPYAPPVLSWTSPDGRSWTPHVAVALGRAITSGAVRMILASGPAGLVAATNNPTTLAATSFDGVDWQVLPNGTFPRQFVINDLRGTATGYMAGGLWVTSNTHWDAAAMWSADGRTWTRSPSLPAASTPATMPNGSGYTLSAVTSLVSGNGGLIAVGREIVAPGRTLWWQSSDGKGWRPLPTYSPLGPTTCPGQACGLQPDGTLVADGQRLIAVRGGGDAGVWISADGRAWRRLTLTGDLPEQTTQTVLLPGGVLLSDGATTWYGEAFAD
jgi:hypothetical protein